MNITLYIPGLHGFSDEIQADHLDQLTLPALSRLLSRSRTSRHAFNTLDSWLYQQFTGDVLPPDRIPVAPITAKADGLTVADDYWLRADPVYLYPDTHSLVIQRIDNIELSKKELQSLTDLLRPFFEETGIDFFAPNPHRWYLRLDEAPGIDCFPPAHILGKPINDFLPSGPDQKKWRVLLNELQMLLNQSEVNLEREAKRLIPVNSLWFWGGGTMPEVRKPVFDMMMSDHSLAFALCQLSEIDNACIDEVQSLHTTQQTLYILDERLLTAVLQNDPGKWLNHLQAIEHQVMQWLLSGLEKKTIRSVTILTDKGEQYLCQPKDLKRFWRRLRSFSAWREI